MQNLRLVLFFFIVLLVATSCQKDDLLTDSSARLDFSDDTILFDTVFVTMGSTNHQLLVYNNNDQRIKISTIRLAGGASSLFRLNVNGLKGIEFHDIEILSKDSLWLFVEVTINPNSSNLPFIVDDSIMFETNGNIQYVKLVAWGQNAHFIKPKYFVQGLPPYDIVSCTGNGAEWDSILPYVIYGYAVVDSNCTLTIKEGTKVYFYNNSGLWIYKDASLKVEGTKEHPVQFAGTRLEPFYSDVAGQWDRIWINEGSTSNSINYAVIKNAFIGLQCEPIIDNNAPRQLNLTNTKILNMTGVGLYTRNYKVNATNCVIANCGAYAGAFTEGGDYNITHCTFANYWSGSQRQTPSIYINNYFVDQNEIAQPVNLVNCNFRNSIIWGSEEQEIETDMITGATSNYLFEYTLLRVESNYNTGNTQHFINIYKNSDPYFMSISQNDYRLDTLSFAKDKGWDAYATNQAQFDLLGIDRSLHLPPDLGAYERED